MQCEGLRDARSRRNRGARTLRVVVSYAPITLVSQSVTPASLPNAGGAVKLQAKLSSEQVVPTGVRAKLVLGTMPTYVTMTLGEGTYKRGTWNATWTAPANKTTSWQTYGVLFEASDADGKWTLITGNNMVELKIAPAPASAKPPASSGTGTTPTVKPTTTAPPALPPGEAPTATVKRPTA